MKQRHQQLFAVFLIFLVANQEFCSAKKFHPRQLKLSEEEFTTLIQEKARREKRSVGAVLFGVVLFASMANIAFDVYLKVEGCCGLYPQTCRDQREFNETRSSITTTSNNIDRDWLLSTNLLTYVQTSSSKNREIALEMKRITQKYEAIVTAVDPEVVIGYNNITNDIKKQVEAKNSTVLKWSNVDVEFQYKSLFDTSQGRLQALSGVIGQITGGALAFAWNWYKTAKIGQMLKTNYGHQLTNVNNQKALKTLGSVDADKFVSDTAVARRNADISTSRGAKAMSVATNVMLLVQLGVEIWMAVMKVKQCESIRDSVRDALNKIKPEKIKMDELYAEIQDHYSNMTGTYNFIRNELSNDDFLGYLDQIKQLADEASTQTTSLKTASSDLTSFMNSIKTTPNGKPFELEQDKLIKSLEAVTFTLDCYQKKVKTFQMASDRCESGNDGDLKAIYTKVTKDYDSNSASCSTGTQIPYTSYADVTKYVTTQASVKGFQLDCTLNDKTKQDLVCSMNCAKQTDADIKKAVGIDDVYLGKFKALCPTFCPLTPMNKITICSVKPHLSLQMVLAMLFKPTEYDSAEVTKVYNECP